MKSQTHFEKVNLPEVDEFLSTYPRYTTLVAGEEKSLYDMIMGSEVFIRARVISDIGYPAVLAVAEDCKIAADTNESITLNGFTKQFVGSAICSLMEANGYRKTGNKKSVPHKAFSVGTCYERVVVQE